MQSTEMQVFLAVCRAGSATRAAAMLGVGVSTVTRNLASLEDRMERPLFERTPSGMRPTAAGEALRPHAERAEAALIAGRSAVEALALPLAGDVVVALPSDMLLLVLLPRLRPFMDAHPSITIVFAEDGRVADLTRREADIAVRIRRPDVGDELVSRRLREVRMRAFCTAERLRALDDPADPASHDWIGWSAGLPEEPLLSTLSGGHYVMRCSSPVTMRHAAASGLGTALLPAIFGNVMPGLVEAPVPIDVRFQLQLITHRAVRGTPAVACVWDELERLLVDGDGDGEEEVRRSLAVYGW